MQDKLYIYIDEAGTLEVDPFDKFFVISCYITDTPELLKAKLDELKQEIEDSPVFAYKLSKFASQGFHACENHFDIRSRYYGLLLGLNFRVYSIVVDKTSKIFNDMTTKYRTQDAIYACLVYLLLRDRILSEISNADISVIFEEYGSKRDSHRQRMEEVISRITKDINRQMRYGITVEVHSKENILLSVIDYVNYVIYQNLLVPPPPQMVEYFKMIEPKIALLHSMHNRIFYSSNNNINFDEIKGGRL